MNEELRNRTLELNDLNTFLETILKTVGLAVAVLDRRQHIQVWNGQARELWGLSSEEAEDQHFPSLDIGLPADQLKQPLQACLSGRTSARNWLSRRPTVAGVSFGAASSACRSGASLTPRCQA